MALITEDEFRNLPLGIKGPRSIPESDHLSVLLETASDQIEDFCDRQFALQQHTEVLRGKDSFRMLLREYPLVSVDTVTWIDDDEVDGSHAASLFRVHEYGLIEFKTRSIDWFDAGRTYTITYTAGYDPIPYPVKHATALQVTELLQPNFGGPQQDVPELVPLSSQLIVELLDPKYRRKARRG